MTKDDDKTKEQLIDELIKTRLKVQELTQLEARRQRAEEERVFSRRQLRLLIDAGPDFFFLKDIALRYQLVNAALVRFFGRDEAEILGRTDVELMPEGAAVACQESDRLAIHEKRIIITFEQVGYRFYETYKFPVIVADEIVGVAGIIRDITDRRRAEDALRESEERFRTLCESSRDAILMMAPDGKVSYWNPAAEQMFGYTSTEAAGKNLHELVVPKRHLEAHRVAYAEFLRSGRGAAVGKTLELQAVRKDGREITVALSLSAERINDNWNAIGILRDITEQREAESQRAAALEALRKSEEQFRAMFEMASIGMAQADLETGRWLRVNQKMCEITGYSSKEMLALCVPEITHPEDREEDWTAFQNVVSGKLPDYRLEKRYIRKDSSIVWVNVNMTVIRDSAGQPIRTVATIEDITGRKHAEAELERSRDFIENVADACFELNLSGKVVFCNESFLKTTGYAYQEYMALSRWDWHPTREETKHVVKIYDDVYRTGIPAKSVEYKSLRKDGTTAISEVSISLIRDKEGNPVGFRGVSRDITERRRAEDALREAHRRLDEIIEYLPDATLVIDADGKVIAWNKAIEQMTGIKAADMLGKGNYEYALPFFSERRPMLIDFVLHPREEIEAKYVSTERGDKVLEGEAYMPALRGDEVYLLGRASALQDSKGNIVGAIESIRDITDRRKAEEKYRAIFENAAEGIFQTTPEGQIISVNPAMASLFGYASPADLIHNVADMAELYANPDDRFSFQREVDEAGTVSQYEIPCVRRDGLGMLIAVNARAIKDKEGNVIRYDGYFADITERKKMENSLKESEERYRMIVENMNDIIWIMDLNFNYKYRSPSNVEVTGRTPEEIMTIPPREQIVPESYALVEKILAEELVNEFGGKPVDPHRSRTVEVEVYHKNGGTVWIEVTGSFIRDENGKPVEILFAGREITARKKIEVALLDSEKRYRMIVENMQDTIWTMDLDLEYTYQSPSEIRVTGFTAEEMMQIPVQDQITPESYAMVEKILIEEMALEFGGVSTDLYRSRTMELEVYCKDGSRIWEEVTATFVRDENGRAAEILFAGRDITERKRIQEALKESEKRYRMIVENMNDAIWTMDLNLRYKYISPDSSILTGFTEEEIRAMPLKEQVTPESYARMGTLLMNELALESGGRPINPKGSRTLEIEAYHKDGSTIWIEIDATFDRAENGKPVELVIAGRNITERKKMQKEKEILERQLIQAQKMEAIGTLAGGIAHDFNNILASMMGFTEMAAKETRQNVRHDYLDQVLQACERAKNLVNQILSFSRMREQERKPLDIRIILKEALGLLRSSLPTTIEMRQNIAPEGATVLADPTQIHQIIMNLCTNAAQAMWEKGGLLTVHLSPVEIDAAGLHPHLDLQPGAYIRLSVDDTGQGIDPAIKDKIFDPFFTTKKTKEGTGLGLSVVYGIVKSYGGAIDVQSSTGKGATFTIYLPCIRLESPAEETSQEEIDLQGHERILFVDDEEMLVKMVRIFFESLGYSITATASSAEALRLFQEKPEGFDLVITDMTMPELTGVELARDLLKIRPDLPIILCTGYSDSINMADARKLNIRAFLQKPLLLKDMGRLVKRLLKN